MCDLAVWCQSNDLSLNVSMTKELIVDYRKCAVVERVESFKFLGVQIIKDLKWSTHEHGREEGTTVPLSPQEVENVWHLPANPLKVLQLYHY